MDDVVFMQTFESIDDLLDDIDCFVLCKSFFFVEIFLKSSSLTVLHDDDGAFCSFEVFNKSDNIWVVFERFHDSYL